MQWLAALCVRRPVLATVLILLLVVVGAYGYSLLGVDRMPKVDFPTIIVTTLNPGAGAEEIDREITDKIEEVVNTISGSGRAAVHVFRRHFDRDGELPAREER